MATCGKLHNFAQMMKTLFKHEMKDAPHGIYIYYIYIHDAALWSVHISGYDMLLNSSVTAVRQYL